MSATPVKATRSTAGTPGKEASTTSNGEAKRCIACAAEATNAIVRDENFEKVMRFYWEGMSIDVKPKELKIHDLCGSCFDSLVEFYDTNDVLVLLEKHLRTLQKSLISQAVKGIETLTKDGLPLLHVHKKMSESKSVCLSTIYLCLFYLCCWRIYDFRKLKM
jgi:hypothetical protein